MTLPEASFSYSGPDPLFTGGGNPIEAVTDGDFGLSVGGRRLLATEAKYSLPADVSSPSCFNLQRDSLLLIDPCLTDPDALLLQKQVKYDVRNEPASIMSCW